MRIVIISDWFAEKMGYAENCLPKALASLGHDVHLVTSNAQIYFDSPTYRVTYEPFIGPPVVECEVKQLDGYTLHRLPYGKSKRPIWNNRLYIKSLIRKLAELRPDIVQTFDVGCPTTYQVALAKPLLGYKLFLESHIHASVFMAAGHKAGAREQIKRKVVDALTRLCSGLSVKCYPISTDAADVAVEHFGVQRRKIQICSLGVDTAMFRPVDDEELQRDRMRLRNELGFLDEEIVCTYTGRLTKDKSPIYLAQAVDKLVREGLPFRGLFVGSGTEADIEEIGSCAGCVVHPFVPVRDLPPFYRASDIGVWPKQESTSQLDAAACGLPLILSDRIKVHERIDGNGLTYKEGDVDDLASMILSLIDAKLRQRMGEIGSKKVRDQFSWSLIARQRAADYEATLRRRRAD